MTSRQLRGNWRTFRLSIEEDVSIDFSRLSRQIDTLIGFGVDGSYINGKSGEFYDQSE
ncbi:MAG: hypothetical protein MI757_06720 [Pirellulales bacterium]|nr:hypothetical protein [Pirellulales bacterium]